MTRKNGRKGKDRAQGLRSLRGPQGHRLREARADRQAQGRRPLRPRQGEGQRLPLLRLHAVRAQLPRGLHRDRLLPRARRAALRRRPPSARPLQAAQPEIDMKLFDAVIARMREGSGLIEALHTTQETYGYLPRRALEEIADEMRLPFSTRLRRGQLLQPVPPGAGRQARDQRLHGHRLPRGRRAAGRRGLLPGARDRRRRHHAGRLCSRCRPSTASAPAPWRRPCASAKTRRSAG